MVTDTQVRLLRKKRMEGKTQEAAAAAAGMSERTARRWETGPLPSEASQERSWRTRKDPFEDVWETEVVPLLEADDDGGLEAKSVLEHLMRQHAGKFEPGQLRTLQRRFRDWRAVHGVEREVFFPQQHEPGRTASIDFTRAMALRVTIAGVAFPHMFFHLVMPFSGWHYVELAFGETFEALVRGLQNALRRLGGVPQRLRMDNLSAATNELKRTGGRTLTERFRRVLEHFGLEASRIQPGEAHENGVVEKGHHILKSAIDQALRLRGSRDFLTVDAYVDFVERVVERDLNEPRRTKIAVEREHLRALPSTWLPTYMKSFAQVRRWSTIEVAKRTYSVPSQLIGHRVEVRLHPDTVEVRYGSKVVASMPRLRGDAQHRIDYRHVIWSLVRKPGAFPHYRYREELFPSLVFRRAYDALRSRRGDRADVEYVRILHLAASTSEALVERVVDELLESGRAWDYATVRCLAQPDALPVPTVRVDPPDLTAYDRLLTAEVAS